MAARGAMRPPEGVTPNLVDPPNRNVEIYVIASLAIACSTLFTALRTYTRMVLMKRRQLEDYLLLVSWLLAFVYFMFMPLGTDYRVGVHQWHVPLPLFYGFLKRTNIADIFYSITSCMLKTAIIVQLYRIFVIAKEPLHWILFGLGAFNILFYFSIMLARVMACIPRKKIWEPETPGHCVNNAAMILSSSVTNVILDISLLVIPMVKTWNLKLRRGNKIAVLAVFGAGTFACVASIMRLVYSVKFVISEDYTYRIADIGLWCDGELSTGVVCACLPVMPRLYRTHIASVVSSLKTRFSASKASATYGRESSSKKVSVPRTDSETEIMDSGISGISGIGSRDVEGFENSSKDREIGMHSDAHFTPASVTPALETNAIEVNRAFSVTYSR